MNLTFKFFEILLAKSRDAGPAITTVFLGK
jgi:hypothetical protein